MLNTFSNGLSFEFVSILFTVTIRQLPTKDYPTVLPSLRTVHWKPVVRFRPETSVTSTTLINSDHFFEQYEFLFETTIHIHTSNNDMFCKIWILFRQLFLSILKKKIFLVFKKYGNMLLYINKIKHVNIKNNVVSKCCFL